MATITRQQMKDSKSVETIESDSLFRRRFSIRLLNSFGRILERTGWSPANRSEDSLIAAAARRAGASEWGHELFREGFHVLLESFRKDANLHFTGWLGIHYLLISHLSNHFGIQHELKQHPQILEEKIRRPLIITGLPRTGTTLLHRLLCTDPAHRWLAYWEAVRPVPPPTRMARDADPRIAEAARILESISRQRPDMYSAHAMNPHYPEECVILFYNTFTAFGFELFARLDQYSQWLARQDITPTYQDYRQQLQLLQNQKRGERWVLKAPVHIAALDALLAVFPDACIVQTHRDLLKVLPSSQSFVHKWRSIYSDQIINHEPQTSSYRLINRIGRCMRVRDSVNSAPFYDVHYTDLVADPINTVRGIYNYFDFKFDDVFESNMRAWLINNPKGKHGKHSYSLEQFGLDRAQVSKEFADYTARFGILPE